jgi:outer membrane lipoprotein-sorting protein
MAKTMFVAILLTLALVVSSTAQQQQPDPTEALKTMLKAQVRGRCS